MGRGKTQNIVSNKVVSVGHTLMLLETEATPAGNQPPAVETNEASKSLDKKQKKSKREHPPKRHRSKQHHATNDVIPPPDPVEGQNSNNEENWADNHDRIEKLSSVFPNNICCDCNESGTQWASVNHGVFICIRCAGVHRSLGVHISKVKSTNMDRWSAAEVALMEAIGNRRGEAFYCAHPPSSSNGLLTKYSSNEEVKRFIERKYVSKEFAVNNIQELLRKIHKQVGYQKPKQHKSGLTTDDALNAAASEKTGAAAKKVDPEQVVRALYGDATTSELTSKIKTIGQQNERKSQTIHGTFGVVNVSSEEYIDRLTMVMQAFEIDREVVESTLDAEGNDEEKAKLLS